MDLIDPAALRPGRLEVHCEVALPDASGRREILALHAAKLGPALAPPTLAELRVQVEQLEQRGAPGEGAFPLTTPSPDPSPI